ncbi:MAG: hypothetical protein PWP27_334 [Clostridiales bacterium]|jgi:hypothetical protein|nr:hypothetical protein [Clostridiales bacterium]MDK2932524.1 hypothetical protein [Clostridiales bacterium]
MVVNWLNTIAYKCPVCGSIEFNNISIFDFSGEKEYTVHCSCGKAFVKIITQSRQKCTISIPCIACNHMHAYTVNFKALWTKRIINFKCTKTNIELCFIGDDDIVRQKVDQYEMQMDKLMNDIGYDDYFKNSTVMLDTIDKIHDIAEKGNLFCECGNHDIDLQIFGDRVELICTKCRSYEMIKACTNQDLKHTFKRNSIILCHDRYDMVGGNNYMRYDGFKAQKRIDYT